LLRRPCLVQGFQCLGIPTEAPRALTKTSKSAVRCSSASETVRDIRISQRQSFTGQYTVFLLNKQERLSLRTDFTELQPVAGRRLAWFSALRRAASKVFLPVDYPASVDANYNAFTIAMIFQIFCSNVSKVFATQAMLLAVGVGTGSVIPLAAVSSWILKDGLGHLGAVAVGTFVNTRFDSDPKRCRFWAAALGKVADFFSILTLHRPDLFVLLSALGGTFGRISLTTAGSCRAKIYETFALRDNLGDVLRCSSTQSAAAQLLGTGVGVLLGPLAGSQVQILVAINAVFTIAALKFSYESSRVVRMRTLNVQRAEIIFFHAIRELELQSCFVEMYREVAKPELHRHLVPSVEEVQMQEVFVRPYKSVFAGSSLEVNPLMHDQFSVLTKMPGLDYQHLLGVRDVDGLNSCPVFALWLRRGAPSAEVIRSFFFVCVCRAMLAEQQRRAQHDELTRLGLAELVELHERAMRVVDIWWPRVASGLTARGWRLDVVFLDAKNMRIDIS